VGLKRLKVVQELGETWDFGPFVPYGGESGGIIVSRVCLECGKPATKWILKTGEGRIETGIISQDTKLPDLALLYCDDCFQNELNKLKTVEQ